MQKLKAVLTVSWIAILAVGCRQPDMRVEALSPQKRRSVRVWEVPQGFKLAVQKWGLRVIANDAAGEITIYEGRPEWYAGLIESVWSKNDDVVDLVVCNSLSASVLIHHNFSTRQTLVNSPVSMPVVADAIRSRYNEARDIQDMQKTLEWACSNDGRERYFALFPTRRR